jgi:hypothetical protein
VAETVVDRLFREHDALAGYLRERGELSFLANFDASFRKMLLMAAASYFESQVTACVLRFVVEKSGSDVLTVSFAKSKGINRQYHTYFDWSLRNATKFFSMFGPEFKGHMASVLKTNEGLAASISAFLELGDLRNTLVHEDFASHPLEKTVDEIYGLYKLALVFVSAVPEEMRKCSASQMADTPESTADPMS